MISAIVAVDSNWGIGYKNQLLIHNKVDMQRFRLLTMNHKVFVGRKTYDSFPQRPLKKRTNFVITKDIYQRGYDGAHLITLDEARQYLTEPNIAHNEFIIGGESIYRELLPLCDYVYVTKIHHSFQNVDTYFPNLDKDENWVCEYDEFIKNENSLDDELVNYEEFTGTEDGRVFGYNMSFARYINLN